MYLRFNTRRNLMNKNTLHGDWNIIKGKIKQQWGKLTDNEIDEVSGNMDELVGKVEKSYGLSKERAKEQYDEFRRTLNDSPADEDFETRQ